MSIQDGKVRFTMTARKRNGFLILGLIALQVIFSLILSVSLAANLIWPEQATGAAGSPMQIAYEGRLTDSAGNALGGTGTAYCFRFSLYDAATSGTKLWPNGTISTTTATSTDGIFNAVIGQADTLTSSVFDFSTTSTAYLQVDVNTTPTNCGATWESLSPRQQVLSSGYSMQSSNVYGTLLKTDTVNGYVQVGTTGGAPTPVYLLLGQQNTGSYVGQACSPNGAMWYNTVTTQALVCEAGVIANIGTTATSTIAAIGTNTATPISAGTVNFSNSNGVSFGINGSTITASVNAGGGGVTLSQWEPYMLMTSTTASSLAPASIWFNTINLPNAVAVSNVNLVRSFSIGIPTATSQASTGTERYSFSQGFSIFTRQNYSNSSTNLSYLTSGSFGMTAGLSYSSTSQSIVVSWVTNSTGGTTSWNTTSNSNNYSSYWTGLKYIRVPLLTTLTAGEYWVGQRFSSTTGTTNQNTTLLSISNVYVVMPTLTLGNFGTAGSVAGWHPGKQGFGYASAFTTNNSMAMSVISSASQQFPYFNFANL